MKTDLLKVKIAMSTEDTKPYALISSEEVIEYDTVISGTSEITVENSVGASVQRILDRVFDETLCCTDEILVHALKHHFKCPEHQCEAGLKLIIALDEYLKTTGAK